MLKAKSALLCLIALTPALTMASQAHAGAVAQGTYQVTIPKSRIEMPKMPAPQSPRVPDQLDLGASSWAPRGFSLASRTMDTTNFSREGAPSFYVNYLKSITNLDGLFLKAGLNWLSLSRSGKVGSGSTPVSESQALQLFSLRAGAEYAPSLLQVMGVQPYAGLAILPSLGMTGRSAFDDGSSYFGIPFEYTAGAQFELSRFGLGWNQASLDLGLTGTAGTVDHSSVAGIGIKGGIRVAL
ncbi:MAG: hypothetical protein ACJ763_12550 [Bdellovibrionia bacterium]